jgi:hypothetical protein
VEGGGKRTIPGGASSFGHLGESEDPAVSQNERRKHTSMCSQPCTQPRNHTTKRAYEPTRNRAAPPSTIHPSTPKPSRTPPFMYSRTPFTFYVCRR